MKTSTARHLVSARRWLREVAQDVMEDWEANFIILSMIAVAGCAYVGTT